MYLFDSADSRPCPLLHFQASHIALMVEAEHCLSTVLRLQTPKGDVAEPQVAALLRHYGRQPGQHSGVAPPAAALLEHYASVIAQLGPLPTAPTHSVSFTNDGSVPSQSPRPPVSTSVLSRAEDADDGVDMRARAEIQSREYAEERPVTCEDLENRPRLSRGGALGSWRFASANDICRFDE